MKIYIIDEDGADLQNMQAWLGEKEHINQVKIFQNHYSLIKAITKHPPNWCFIRLGRATIPGLKLAKMIHGVNMGIKVVFISEVQDYALHAFDVGAKGYLLSPVQQEKLDSLFLHMAGIV